jgi:NAD(P)-dependent dehydrogenase (short-subunit alcohol dehydrogenase family)
MDLGLAGSTAVVTGGSKGMGLAIATTFAEEGAKVAVMARGAEALEVAAATLHDAGAQDAVGITVDMSDPSSIAAGFETVAQRWGELNSLVHTIGPGDGYFEEMGRETATSRRWTMRSGRRRSRWARCRASDRSGLRCRCCGPRSGAG